MKSTNLLSRTCIAMVLTMLATTAIAQTQAIHTLKMTDGTVNQNYNTDALIDMQSTSKGLLLPRVELTGTTAAAPLANHTAGMVVYNTVSAGSGGTAVSPGYYYNDGTQWVKIGSAAAISAWGQYGNTGTTATANWIGTNDVADFVTKTNGAERLRVTSSGKLLVGTATSLTGGANAIMQINNGTTNGALQIVDGTQGAGKVLTSDANGLATWTDGSGLAWTLKGNSGITANNAAYGSSLTAGTGNWLGTINSADLILAANNKEGLRVNTAQQVLIGTTTVPTGGTTAKVIIDNGTTAGALQIKDGTEGANKILVSDANGVATWKDATSASKISYAFSSRNSSSTSFNIVGDGGRNSFYTGSTLTLAAGDWLVWGAEDMSIKNVSGNSVSGVFSATVYLTTSNPGSAGYLSTTPPNYINSGGSPNTNITGFTYYGYVTSWPNLWSTSFSLSIGTVPIIVSCSALTTFYIVGDVGAAWSGQTAQFTSLNGTSSVSGWRAIKLQ